MYYASIGLLSIILHVIVNADILFRTDKAKRSAMRVRYRMFLFAVMLFYFSDALWGFFFDLRIVPIAYADTVLFFASMGLTLLLWIRFVVIFLNKKNRWSMVLTGIGWSLFTFELVALIINFFFPFMFKFEADGEYVPGKARYFILFVQFVVFAGMGIFTLIRTFKTKPQNRFHYNAITVSGFTMAFFIALQAESPLMPLYSVGCLLATSIINTYVDIDEKTAIDRQMDSMKQAAFRDYLTGIRNANAYAEYKKELERDIRSGLLNEFGIVVFDLNKLKTVNDNLGHEAGDRYIQESCRLICTVFKHSPVFRIGGDEFVAILKNDDYKYREDLMEIFNNHIKHNQLNGGPVIAAGLSLYEPDTDSGVDSVFDRGDELMYLRKKQLKARESV